MTIDQIWIGDIHEFFMGTYVIMDFSLGHICDHGIVMALNDIFMGVVSFKVYP
jgi:hypothetical protein